VGNIHTERTVLSPTNCGDIRLKYIMALSEQGVTSTAFRDSSVGVEDYTLHTPNSQFGEVPRSMGCDNFTVKSALLVLVDLSQGIAKQSDEDAIGWRHVRYSSR
jgi:hypothetical protein